LHTGHPGAEAATADEIRRAAVLFHRAGGPVVTRAGETPLGADKPTCARGRREIPRIRCGPPLRIQGHTAGHTAARRTGCRRIGCGWPVAGRAAQRATGSPGRSGDLGIPCGRPKKEGFLLFKYSRKILFPSKNPRKSILSPKITKPFPVNF
jgi:hypothetical protein